MIPKVPKKRSLLKYLKEIDKNKIYSNFGPLNSNLISQIANWIGTDESNLVTCSNATLGLQGAVKTCASSNNGSWNLPSWTFAATPTAIMNAGKKVKFVDVELDSWRVSTNAQLSNLVDVLPFGADLDFEREGILESIRLVDAAASFDALRNIEFPKKHKIGIVISLHATKLLPAGEGGVFVSNDVKWIERFKQWTNFGFDSTRDSRIIGNNAKLSEYSAAVALASLDEWDITRKAYLDISKMAKEMTKKYGLSVSPAMNDGFVSPYWIVNCKSEKLKMIIRNNAEKELIKTRDWWSSGCHKMKAFNKEPKDLLLNTKKISKVTIGLPFHLYLTKKDWKSIDVLLEKSMIEFNRISEK